MAEGEVTPGIRIEEYIGRRKKLVELLPENSLAIISSAPVKMMTDVVPYTFRQDADYLYLTGCQQPGGVAVLSDERGLCMFMPESTPKDIAWEGEVAGVDAASEVFKADQAYPISKLPEVAYISSLSGLSFKFSYVVDFITFVTRDLFYFSRSLCTDSFRHDKTFFKSVS
jgi:Xaa-Pro aminopeptidase